MNANSTDIALIINHLAAIKYATIGLFVLLGIIATSNIVRSFMYLKKELQGINSNKFRDSTNELIEKNELKKAREILEKKLETHPNHSYANYYLARVCLYENKYDDCIEILNKLEDIQPDWKKKFIDPILIHITEKTAEKNC
ncbi:MAG: tetratricopeptide repeat protein [Desulfobulbaceae bacterium]|nr:tetratricopeptide repeat protein [Desulfobulbaceae bacterium]